LTQTAKERKKQAEDLKQHIDDTQATYNEAQKTVNDTKMAAQSLRSELNSRQKEQDDGIEEERVKEEMPEKESQENEVEELAGPVVVERSIVETSSASQDRSAAEPVIHSELCFVVPTNAETAATVVQAPLRRDVNALASPPRIVFENYEAYSPPPPPRQETNTPPPRPLRMHEARALDSQRHNPGRI